MATIRVERTLPYPPDVAFAWLTDYEEADPQRASGHLIAKRKILAKDGNKVRMEGEHRAFGRTIPSVYEVELDRSRHAWVSRVVEGPRRGSVTRYSLQPEGRGSRLRVEYRMRHEDALGRFILVVGRVAVRRQLVAMWESYEASMARELAE